MKIALASVLLLGACGGERAAEMNQQLLTTVAPLLSNLALASDPVQGERPAVDYTATAMAQDTSQFMAFNLTTMGLSAPARIVARNGGAETWQAQAGYSASFRDGVLVATRGLGHDLMAADVAGTAAALRSGGGSAMRVMEFLNSQEQIISMQFECTVAATGTETVDLGLRQVAARTFSENCANNRLVFENLYWLDSAGTIVQSRQFVSQTVAYLRSNRL